MKVRRKFDKLEREDIVRMAEAYLWEDESKTGLNYLLNTRCLSDDVIRAFKIGYLPDDLNHQLYGRIIMPLYDASGNLICVTSRIPRDPSPTDELPHYWHEAYEKSFYLYGINVAKEYMRRWNFAVLVEGQIDAIQLHKNGLKNAVAICGTSLSLTQYSTILRYCEDVIVILDNDENKAGQKGAKKIQELTSQFSALTHSSWLPRTEYKIGYVEIEGAKDPDEYVKKFGYQSLRSKLYQSLMELRSRYVY